MSTALKRPGIRLLASDLIALRALALKARSDLQFAALPGGHATRLKGQGIEVADIRDYLPGDDIRHLDRSSTARTGQLHVRQFQAEQDHVRYVVADMRSPMLWGLKRAFLSVAAAETLVLDSWPLVEMGGRVGLLAIADSDVLVVPPRARIRGMLDVIGGLVQAHANALHEAQQAHGPTLTLDHALHRLDRLAPSGSEIVIASGYDTPGQELAQILDALAQRRAISLFHITNTDNLPTGRYPVRMDGGRNINLYLQSRDHQRSIARIAGRDTVVIDAAAPLAQTAQIIARSHKEREV